MQQLQLVLLSAGGAHKQAPLIDIDATALVQLGLFLFLMAVLSKLVFKPYLALKAEQAAKTAGGTDAADAVTGKADAKLEDYDQRLLAARREAAEGRTKKRTEGEEVAAKRLAEARKRTETKLVEARERLEKSIPEAEAELKQRAEELAVEVAGQVLGREMTA